METVFRIAAIGVLLAVLSMVLKKTGREDIADLVTLAGLIVVLLMIVTSISSLFDTIRNLFLL